MAKCSVCGKSARSGHNVSHSQIHTKRKFKPNLQKVYGLLLCTSCLRTAKKQNASASKEKSTETKTKDTK